MMVRLIAAAALIAAITAPAFACEWNKSAGADSQSTVASQSSGAQQSKPVHNTSAPSATPEHHIELKRALARAIGEWWDDHGRNLSRTRHDS